MTRNFRFLREEATLAWLAQFSPEDQQAAVTLLSEIALVSRDQFAERLQTLVLQRLNAGELPVGVYVEREIRRRKGVPNRLFKETKTKSKRAFGGGPQPVKPAKQYDTTVGSEGIVAQLIGELCRQHPKRLYSHPGPDLIRKHKIRRFMLVTDLIGSGERATTYLGAAWKLRSVRSWWSRRANSGLAFEVIAYAATAAGRAVVEGHPSQPAVHAVTICPTVKDSFSVTDRIQIKDLCVRYNPKKNENAYGKDGGGALIAFSHGVPNNAPPLLYRRGRNWEPLFPSRITSTTRRAFDTEEHDADAVKSRLVHLHQTRLAEAASQENVLPRTRLTLLVLAALSRPPRDLDGLLRKTRLTYLEVEKALSDASKNDWIDGRNHLTEMGRAELRNARRHGRTPETLPTESDSYYHPKSLRMPSEVSR